MRRPRVRAGSALQSRAFSPRELAAYGVAFTLAMEPRLFGYFVDQLVHPKFG
jgi:hypothetical protein